MVDQSHNLKGKMEAMIHTVCTAQELYVKAAIVDHALMAPLQQSRSLVEAEETLRRILVRRAAGHSRIEAQSRSAGRSHASLPGKVDTWERITAERKECNAVSVTTYA
jgi:L-rhamnose isomerase/sugar isomerase